MWHDPVVSKPQPLVDVLAVLDDQDGSPPAIIMAHLGRDNAWHWSSSSARITGGNITHWMPLPPVPMGRPGLPCEYTWPGNPYKPLQDMSCHGTLRTQA